MKFEPRQTEIITVLGLGKSVYDWIIDGHTFKATWERRDEQIWTVNAGAAMFRHDVVFDMHTDEWLETLKVPEIPKARRGWLKDHDKPIVMPMHYPDLPTSRAYPLGDVIRATNSAYFTNGLAYMLALVLVLKPKMFRLFGADFSYSRDLSSHDEPGRCCCEYWMGRIREAGIRIELPGRTNFMDLFERTMGPNAGRIYGYHEPLEFMFPEEGGQGIFIGPDYADK